MKEKALLLIRFCNIKEIGNLLKNIIKIPLVEELLICL